MANYAFSFTGSSQTSPVVAGTNGYNKHKDVGRDTFFVLIDQTSSFTGSILLKAEIKEGATTYTANAGDITEAGVYAFLMHPNTNYYLQTFNFTGTATGVLSDGSTVSKDLS